MAVDAALSGLFAYMGGPVASQLGKIAEKGFVNVEKNIYRKELKNLASNIAEEALTTITAGLAKFTGTAYMKAFKYTLDLWLE